MPTNRDLLLAGLEALTERETNALETLIANPKGTLPELAQTALPPAQRAKALIDALQARRQSVQELVRLRERLNTNPSVLTIQEPTP